MIRRTVIKATVVGALALSWASGTPVHRPPERFSEWRFERVAGPFGFSEGPVWTGDVLLFSDIPNSRILRYDPRSRTCDEYRTGTYFSNGLALDKAGNLYGCEGIFHPVGTRFENGPGRRIVRYEPGGETVSIAETFESKRFNSPNDLVVDSKGRIWFSDPRYARDRWDMELDHESVFRVDPRPDGSWSVVRITFDTTRPNGLIVTPDLKILYVAQSEHRRSRKRELRAYPINDDGSVGAYEVLHDFGPHRGIDGMRLDSEHNIVASAGSTKSGAGPMIYVFAPSGRVIETHPMPVNPTNCCFGDDDLQTLYVTAMDGGLYRARTHRQGLRTGRAGSDHAPCQPLEFQLNFSPQPLC